MIIKIISATSMTSIRSLVNRVLIVRQSGDLFNIDYLHYPHHHHDHHQHDNDDTYRSLVNKELIVRKSGDLFNIWAEPPIQPLLKVHDDDH